MAAQSAALDSLPIDLDGPSGSAWREASTPSSASSESDEDDDGPGDDDGRRRRGEDDGNLRISIPEGPMAPALTTPSAKAGSHPWPFQAAVHQNGDETGIRGNGVGAEGDAGGLAASTKRRAGSVTQWLKSVSAAGLVPDHEEPPASAMPHEILLHILRSVSSTGDLKRALLVCKAWCQCGVELLWHKPSFPTTASLIKMLVTLANPHTFPYESFIRRLNFSGLAENMSDHILVRLTSCIRLERLTLSSCSTVTDISICRMLDNVPGLVALDLSDCKLVTDATLIALGKNCHKLQGLNLCGCKSITNAGIVALKECTALRRLKLKGCELVSDVGLIAVISSCPLLLEVDLVGCKLATNATLWTLWKYSAHLRELSLNGLTEINDGGFPSTENSLMAADGETDPLTGEESAVGPPALNIQGNDVLGPKMHFDHVRFLDLTSLGNLTDASVDGIVTHMPRIRNLILAKCSNLTDESLNSISRLGKHLHYLHLGHVRSLTDKAVIKLARSCTRLRYIDLACCTNLTDISVFELATCLPRLKRVGLVRVTNITDASITALLERTSLERIHLSYCENISVAAVHWLLQKLYRLTHLSLTGVPAFRRADLQIWCRPAPRDFNTHQRQAFCVYSGKGVGELRRYLYALHALCAHNVALDQPVSAFHTMPDQRTMQTAMNQVRQLGSSSSGGSRRRYGDMNAPGFGGATDSAHRWHHAPWTHNRAERADGTLHHNEMAHRYASLNETAPQSIMDTLPSMRYFPTRPQQPFQHLAGQREIQAAHDFFGSANPMQAQAGPSQMRGIGIALRSPIPLHSSTNAASTSTTASVDPSLNLAGPSTIRHRAFDDTVLERSTNINSRTPQRSASGHQHSLHSSGGLGGDGPRNSSGGVGGAIIPRRRSEQELVAVVSATTPMTTDVRLEVPDRTESASPMDLSDDERPPMNPDVMQIGS